jgi:hypothetical protein
MQCRALSHYSETEVMRLCKPVTPAEAQAVRESISEPSARRVLERSARPAEPVRRTARRGSRLSAVVGESTRDLASSEGLNA